MSVAKRGDGRFVVKFKDEEGRWKQRSFRTDEEARQFDADCQYDKVENTRLTLLEAVLVYLKNTEYAEKNIATTSFWSVAMTGKTAITGKVQRSLLPTVLLTH